MVVTVGAINKKDVNNLYKESEKTGGEKPIDLIKSTRPILIVDEPQSVDGGLSGAGKTALDAMNPLCTLRYSATHVDKHQMVYRLDAVDAHDKGLVKQIEVAAATVEDAFNKPYVRLLKVENKRGRISALVELDKLTASGVRRKEAVVVDGDNLEMVTSRTIHRILTASGRLDDFKRNPQQFIELAAEAIKRCKQLAVVDGIKYHRLGEKHFYAQELFEQQELTGYLKNLIPVEKSVYEKVVYDSDVEASFADQLEKNLAIKVYAKLPGWFRIPTPLDTYNPDWAVLVETDGEERIYFVVETKSGLFTDDIPIVDCIHHLYDRCLSLIYNKICSALCLQS